MCMHFCRPCLRPGCHLPGCHYVLWTSPPSIFISHTCFHLLVALEETCSSTHSLSSEDAAAAAARDVHQDTAPRGRWRVPPCRLPALPFLCYISLQLVVSLYPFGRTWCGTTECVWLGVFFQQDSSSVMEGHVHAWRQAPTPAERMPSGSGAPGVGDACWRGARSAGTAS